LLQFFEPQTWNLLDVAHNWSTVLASNGALINVNIELSQEIIIHSRRALSIFDLLAIFGGTLICAYYLMNILVRPIAEHQFKIALISECYSFKTPDMTSPLRLNIGLCRSFSIFIESFLNWLTCDFFSICCCRISE
jgi:hypothetical protein